VSPPSLALTDLRDYDIFAAICRTIEETCEIGKERVQELSASSSSSADMAATPAIREISIAHSPDSDDAFMFYGLATTRSG